MLLLVLLDAGLIVLFPLFIGYAIDDAMLKQFEGPILLGVLGFATLLVGAFRRFYDSRFYARVFEKLGTQIGSKENEPTSTRTAHLGFLSEVVEFLENSLPEIANNLVGLLGTLAIIAAIDFRVFIGCVIIMLVIIIVYWVTEKRTTRFNASYNDELEQQVNVVTKDSPILLRRHLKQLMKWNIKLSDLETINFSIVWLFMMAFLVLAIVMVASDAGLSFGSIFSLILYLFQFIESTTVMPVFYQQWLRLKEITGRLKSVEL